RRPPHDAPDGPPLDSRRDPVSAPEAAGGGIRGRGVSFESFVARRYLATSRKTAHVALITAISIGGLALGVMALVSSLALLSRFQDRIRAQMAERTPHLTVSPERGAVLADAGGVERALRETPGVVEVSPVVQGRGWLAPATGGPATPVRYR